MTHKNDHDNKTDLSGNGSTESETNANLQSPDNDSASEGSQGESPVINEPVAAHAKDSAPGKAGAKPPQPDNKTRNKPLKTGRGVALLALLIALCAILGAGYLYWDIQQYKPQARIQAQLAAEQLADRTLEQARSQNSAVQGTIAQLEEKLINQQQLTEELSLRLASARRQIGEITLVSRQSWMLAEAEYLLRLANQRLMTEQASASALALLHSADNILVDVDDVRLYDVRTVLAHEIAMLEALGETDVEGHFLRLAALAEQINAMSLLQPVVQHAPGITDPKLGEQNHTQALDSLVEKLLGLVRISQRGEPVKPLLSPQQHYYVQQNLRLMLEQAQLALLQRKPELYEQSLSRAGLWINEYFALNSTSQALFDALEQLRGVNVAPPMPDISGSLKLLKHYLNNRPDEAPAAATADNQTRQDTGKAEEI